ncbi:GbpC/Spa domain-containing protein [Streptococcus porcorum]|uniref:Tetratricopeptide (TPR) repeat protein n=1 Tax=Streptococcus porcorum TaxID=701526 RepID=A0ABV2JJ48_9STRE
MKKKSYQVLGISLFSSLLLATPKVLADEISLAPAANSNTSETTANQVTNYTDHQPLNQALSTAASEGIVVVADDTVSYDMKQAVENDYNAQTQTVNQLVSDYQAAKADYQKADQAYQNNQKEVEDYQKETQAYQNYLAAEKQYQTDYKQYQNQLKTYETAVAKNDLLKTDYQAALSQYQQEETSYQKALGEYQKQVDLNKEKEAQFQKDLANYETALNDYEVAKKEFDQVKADNDRLLSLYEEKVNLYQQNHREWELEKALYDEKFKAAEADTLKEGFLSKVHAQYLIFKNEPNAKVSFEGVQDFFGANHDFGLALAGISGNPKDITRDQQPNLAIGVGGATAAGAGDGYGVFLKQGQPITVTYTGLEKSTYKGRAITKVIYTFELVSTFSPEQVATAFIYKDPTKTIYVGHHGDNHAATDFTIHQTIRFYYNDTEQVILDEATSSLLSLSSLNHSFEFGEQEYVKLSDTMTFIPITGSSVSSKDGIVASFGSNNSKADGSKYDRADWDNDGHDNEYFGAGVAKIVGSTIAFDFGIRYSQADINQSSNPGQLRNSSRLWFAVNTDLKASGILDTQLREEPKAPEKPTLNTAIKEPSKPNKPQAPELISPQKPQAPTKPSEPNYQPLPKKPVAPNVPKKINKPQKPKAMAKPTPPNLPVIFYHKASFKPVVKNAVAKPVQATTISSKTAKARVYYLPVMVSPTQSPIYPSYRPNYTFSPTKIVGTLGPQHSMSIKSLNPVRIQSQKKPNQHSSNKKDPDDKDDWFGENTGIVGDKQTDLINFIKEIGQKAKKKHGHDLNKINRDIALTLASPSYGNDKLQNFFSTFKGSIYKVPNDAKRAIISNHKDGKIDFAHVMTTLASLEDQKFSDNLIKKLSSRSFLLAFFLKNPILGHSINDRHQRNIILEQNSLLGDIFTTMPVSDIYTDMDSIILSRHPKYKHLPLDQRILAYYNQEHLDKKRKDLFLEVYGMNKGKDKGEAQLSSFIEIVASFLTIGGLGLLGYSVKNKKDKNIDNHIHQVDTVLYDGNINKFLKHPLKTTKAAIAKTIEKKVVKPVTKALKTINNKIIKPVTKTIKNKIIKPITKAIKTINNKVIKPVVRTFKKTRAKVIKNIKTFVTKTVPKKVNKIIKKVPTAKKVMAKVRKVIPQPVKKAIKKVTQPLKRVVRKVVQPLRRVRVARPVFQPVRKVIRRAAPVIRKVNRPVQKSSKKRRR